jgi:hypothetical protein
VSGGEWQYGHCCHQLNKIYFFYKVPCLSAIKEQEQAVCLTAVLFCFRIPENPSLFLQHFVDCEEDKNTGFTVKCKAFPIQEKVQKLIKRQ